MTKKDYELIARVLASRIRNTDRYISIASKQNNPQALDMLVNEYNHYKYIAYDMATELQAENSRFNRKMFLQACGLDY